MPLSARSAPESDISGFDFDPAGQSQEAPFAGVTGVYAVPETKSSTWTIVLSDMLLPRENCEPVAKDDSLIFDFVGEADAIARDYLHG
jgi:hypothetical protein